MRGRGGTSASVTPVSVSQTTEGTGEHNLTAVTEDTDLITSWDQRMPLNVHIICPQKHCQQITLCFN